MLQWADVVKDKSLQNLSYKIELDARGRIIMTPASNRHGMYQSEIDSVLRRLMRGGRTITECSIQTLDGVKVADVAWMSGDFFKQHHDETPFTGAPEICAEIISPSTSSVEMEEKITLYLAKGAHEVWQCDENGNMTFTDHSGKLGKSKLAPRFPSKISIL